MSDEAQRARMDKLRAMAERDPKASFPRYALGLEHKGRGETAEALAMLKQCLAIDPDHAYAWFHIAKIHDEAGRAAAARAAVQDGLAAARRKNDAKAMNELLELEAQLADR